MIKKVKPQKVNDFLISFMENPKLWMKKQINEEFEFEEEIQMKIIEKDEFLLEHIKNPTKTVCLAAVKLDGSVIQFIYNPTEEVQLEAVKQNGCAIKFIYNPTEEVQLKAVKRYGCAIKFIYNPTEEMQLAAVKEDGWAIQYVKNPTEKVQLEAVKSYGWAIQFIEKLDQTFKIVEAFFNFDWKNGKREKYYEYLSKTFITKEQALIMKPELSKFVEEGYFEDCDDFSDLLE